MKICVYAIKSLHRNYIYVGQTNDINRRFYDHTNGLNKTTSPYAPFEIIYTAYFENRVEAKVHEKYLKSGVGKTFLKSLIIPKK